MKRSLLGTGLLILLLGGMETPAQPYPVKPVRVILPQQPGSSVDTITRIVAHKMSEVLGQQFVIDNRGGAGGLIGAQIGARSAPDGYTLLAGAASSLVITTFTYKKPGFDPFKDFEPISLIVNAEGILVVHINSPIKSVKELIALAKAQPGSLRMASAGVGSSTHLAGIMFTSLAGIDTVHVPYKGGMTATSIMTGETHWGIAPAAALMGHIKAGRLRAIGISSKTRSPLMPDLPTIAEAGVPGYEYNSWNGFFAPRGAARPYIKTLHAALQKTLAEPDVKELYAVQGLVPLGSASPEEFGKFFRADFERIAKLVKLAGIKPE
jgi:tripartite-type tricarboxylate transporter receptor subunit TctC